MPYQLTEYDFYADEYEDELEVDDLYGHDAAHYRHLHGTSLADR